MRSNPIALTAALAMTAVLTSSTVWAAATPTATQPAAGQTLKSQQKTADADFSKLSADGSQAFQDLTLSRLAIFDGRIDDAKKYVHEADTDFDKAKTDDTVFTKAEADLTSPKMQANIQAQTDTNKTSAADMTKPVAWLPVDGTVMINENYKLNPVKTAAVADANKSLQNGDRKGAMEKLKLADMDTDIVLAVVPIQQTIANVHQAAQLIDSGKYYEGSQLLKKAQDDEHFVITDIVGTPKKTANSMPSPDHSSAPAQNVPAK